MPLDLDLVAKIRAWLVKGGMDLEAAALERFDATLTPVIDVAVALTTYAWKYRSPGDPVDPMPEEAEGALAIARKVYDAVLARLPGEVRP